MARLFNGSTDYLRYNGAVRNTVPMTIAASFYPTDLAAGTQFLMSIGDTSSANRYYDISIASSVVRCSSREGENSNFAATGTTTLQNNTWYHACARFIATNDKRIYLNGVEEGTNTNDNDPTTVNATAIGRLERSSPSNYFNGRIAEFGIWDVALTPDEILALAQGVPAFKIRPANLISRIPIWGRHSPEIDITKNNRPFVVNGTPAFVAGPPVAPFSRLFRQGLLVEPVSASGSLNLSVNSGSLTLTGSAITVNASSELAVNSGSLSLAGQTVTVGASANLNLPVNSGSLTLTGSAITVNASSELAVNSGSLSLVGQTVTVGASTDLSLPIISGALSLTGQAVVYAISSSFSVANGVLSFSGQTATVQTASNVSVTSGQLNLTGQNVDLNVSKALTPVSGTLTLTGSTVTAGIDSNVEVTTNSGQLSLQGYTVGVLLSISVGVGSGSLTISGSTVVSSSSAAGEFTAADRAKLNELHAWMSNIDGLNIQEAMRVLLAVIAGKSTITNNGGGDFDVVYRSINDSKDRVTADVLTNSRISVTIDET